MKIRKSHVALCLALSLIAIGSYAFYRDYTSTENTLKRACETLLIKRLKAPSGYKLINATYNKVAMNPDDFIAYAEQHRPQPLPEYEKQYLKGTKAPPISHEMDIEYDAPNSFGAVIRGSAYCEYVSEWGDYGPSGTLSVYLDGESESGYLVNQINKNERDAARDTAQREIVQSLSPGQSD